MGVLAALFLVTVAIGLFLSNTPTAVLVAPMAVEIGVKMGIPPQACAMTVAIACSAAFISPLGSPVNMIVREPGGYTFMDYARVGVPLVALSLAATLVLVRFIYLR
jgi:di/tricarboxylate transporter